MEKMLQALDHIPAILSELDECALEERKAQEADNRAHVVRCMERAFE